MRRVHAIILWAVHPNKMPSKGRSPDPRLRPAKSYGDHHPQGKKILTLWTLAILRNALRCLTKVV